LEQIQICKTQQVVKELAGFEVKTAGEGVIL